MEIRQININDNFIEYMNCVKDLNSGEHTSTIEEMKNILSCRSKNIETYILLIDNQIIATATIIFENKIRYNKPCAHIEDVGVNNDYRKMGYGKTIVDHCIEVAKNKNCYKLKLFCSDKNISFYNKLGFNKSNNGMELIL